jgi:diaminopimelate decarboxylase
VAPTAPLVFGGPAKTDVELATAVGDHDTIVNVESRHELERLEVVAARHHRQQPACLRVNLTGPLPVTPVAMAGAPTQFGIDEQDVPEILAAARCRPHVDLHGFHFHSVSNHLDAGDHLALVQRYLDHAIAWGDAARGELRTVNIGGGVGVDVHTAIHCFDWSMFTTGLAQARTRVPQSTLMLECGRYLAAACGTYATQVLDVKRTHGQWFALVRGGTHHLRLPVSWGYSHPFEVVPIDAWPHPLPRPAVADARVTVTGELCTPKDVLAADVPVARLRAGDILLFPFAGAYGWSISHHNFLRHPHPRVIYLA